MIAATAGYLSVPLSEVYNACLRQCVWPSIWKLETVSVIPKKPHPTNLGGTRNISCTALFSKTLEFFVLEQLKNEASPSNNQYGGISGSGTNHYLAKVWTDILETVDQENSACALVSVDFAKAFNSMCHNECLAATRRLGASPHTVEMIRAFLTDRQMQFKVDSVLSTKRHLKGGAPQGTLLGNYLFVLTTNDLEKKDTRQLPASVTSDDLEILTPGMDVEDTTMDTSVTTDDDDRSGFAECSTCLLYTSPSPRDRQKSRMPSSA